MHILLRTLTRKSIIDGGKNKGLTVQEVLSKSKVDLIYSYFNYSNITFMDDILDELKIYPEDRIAKPGKDPEKFEKYKDRNLRMFVKMKLGVKTIEETNGAYFAYKKNYTKAKFKARYKGLIERERKQFSKGAMQRRNHGK